MRKPKKSEYYGTSMLRYVSDSQSRWLQQGDIYLNTRDVDDDKLLRVLAHECAHILQDLGKEDEIHKYLKEKVDSF